MAGIYRRSLGRAGRKQSEIIEVRSTPVDELSSWLPDDVCTNCGASTLRGKLFCSEDCKLADARQMSQETDIETLAPSFSIPAPEAADNKFRYTCPPSPSLLAQLSPLHRATHLTSPALAAHQSSLPPSRAGSLGAVDAIGSVKKRSSSRSTLSSVSDSNGSAIVSTDPSTPSPASEAVEDGSSDLDALDFQLPPSISSASAVMLRRASKPKHDTSHSPVVPRSNDIRTPKSPLWYARRPSTTNARGSFYTSPAIIATSKVNATSRDTQATEASFRDKTSTAMQSDPVLLRKAAKDLLSGAMDSSTRARHSTYNFGRSSIAVRRNLSQDTGTRSPQPVHSVASSAGKTLQAVSPPDSRPFSPLTIDGCDRCRTRSNISGELDIYASSFVSSHSRGRSSSSRDPDERHRGRTQSHKHSHSAAAALLFTQVYTPDGNMTDHVRAAASAQPSPLPSVPALQADPHRATPPRGRSKARGRSSHRRSPSPPRAAARRDSSKRLDTSPAPVSPRSHPISISARSPRLASDKNALHIEKEYRSDLPLNTPPLSLNSTQKSVSSEEVAQRGRSRGRSTRRDRESRERGSASRSRARWVHKDCELSWAAYGHRDSDRGDLGTNVKARLPPRGRDRPKTREFTDPGFDDIDLELDDGADAGSHSSLGESVELLPTRGRTTVRA